MELSTVAEGASSVEIKPKMHFIGKVVKISDRHRAGDSRRAACLADRFTG